MAKDSISGIACNDTRRFICDGDLRIRCALVCDGYIDCLDGQDEAYCHIVPPNQKYQEAGVSNIKSTLHVSMSTTPVIPVAPEPLSRSLSSHAGAIAASVSGLLSVLIIVAMVLVLLKCWKNMAKRNADKYFPPNRRPSAAEPAVHVTNVKGHNVQFCAPSSQSNRFCACSDASLDSGRGSLVPGPGSTSATSAEGEEPGAWEDGPEYEVIEET